MAVTLNTYVTQVQRILHDLRGDLWGTAEDPNEIIDYVNQARRRVATDTQCLKAIADVTLLTDIEKYGYPSISNSDGVISVLTITVHWGNRKYALEPFTFHGLDIQWRTITTYRQRPFAWAPFDDTSVYIAPVPNQNYESEWTCTYIPVALTELTSAEVMPVVFTDLVQYYAASIAYYNDKAYAESDKLLQKYDDERRRILGGVRSVIRGAYREGIRR